MQGAYPLKVTVQMMFVVYTRHATISVLKEAEVCLLSVVEIIKKSFAVNMFVCILHHTCLSNSYVYINANT